MCQALCDYLGTFSLFTPEYLGTFSLKEETISMVGVTSLKGRGQLETGLDTK